MCKVWFVNIFVFYVKGSLLSLFDDVVLVEVDNI